MGGAHVHQTILNHENSLLTVVDLGIDRVKQYVLEPSTGLVKVPHRICTTVLPNANGPRHIVFHDSLPIAFVVNELTSTLTALHYDRKTGALTRFDRLSKTPDSFRVSVSQSVWNIRNFCIFLIVW